MVARYLNFCGLSLGPEERLMPPHPTNALGFFENLDFHAINERILAHFGGRWDRPPVLPPGWHNDAALAPLYREARALAEGFRGSEPWGWKDPRTTLLLPFWQELFPDLRFVICVRHPLEVARSLHARDRIPLGRGVALWAHYTLEAIRHTEGRPRILTWYDDYFPHAAAEVRRVAAFCGLTVPEDAEFEAAVEELRHHAEDVTSLLAEERVAPEHKLLYLGLRARHQESAAGAPAGEQAPLLSALEAVYRERGLPPLALEGPAAAPGAERVAEPPDPASGNPHRYKVSVIIPAWNKLEYTQRCLVALAANTPPELYELIVVDNGSTDGTGDFLACLEGDVKVITNQENLGFARACNQGAAVAEGDYLLFLNNDTEPQPGWLEPLVHVLDTEPDVGAVGCKLLFPDGTLQHAGVVVLEDRALGHHICAIHQFYRGPADLPEANVRRDVAVVTAASFLVRRSAFEQAGGFDEAYWNGYEDVDLCFKLGELGWRIVYEPASCLVHHESVSGPERHVQEDRNLALLIERWRDRVVPDLLRTPEAVVRVHPRRSPVSVIIVTYNSADTIVPCVESVLATIRAGDEVVIVDNASADGTPDLLRDLAAQDPRVRYVLSAENLGFSAGCNLGIRLARGRYVVLLNPDTVVYGGWLDRMMSCLLRPDVGAVGPTSDYVAGLQKWQLHAPEALPADAGPADIARLLANANRGKAVETKLLIGFCMLLPREVLDRVGLLDEALFLGNDDLDLSWRLRLAGLRLLVATDAFVHHAGQVSFRSQPEEHTRRLVQESTDALARKLVRHYGPGAVPSPEELWGITWFTPSPGILDAEEPAAAPGPAASIVVLTCNQLPVTRLCVESLFRHTRDFELILVDNGSTDGTVAYLQELASRHPNVRLILNRRNLGFPAGCNQGMAAARGRYVVLLNNDTVVSEGWLEGLIAAAQADMVGIVGPRTNRIIGPQMVPSVSYDPDSLQGFDAFVRAWREEHGRVLPVHRVIGFCMLIRREVLDRIGGLDPAFGTGNFEDDDYCIRAQLAGFRVAVADGVFIHHFGSVTFREQRIDYQALMERNWRLFKAKWGIPKDRALEDGYALRDLLYRPFSREQHYVPLEPTPEPAAALPQQGAA